MTAPSAPSPEHLNRVHREVYDHLADEYETRREALTPVVSSCVDALVSHAGPGAHVLDVGCGAGIATGQLLARGCAVTALDISPRMVEITARYHPAARTVCGDFEQVRFEQRFDAMIALAFIHLFPKPHMQRILAKMHADLREGGLLYTGTSASEKSSEGFERKADYPDAPPRYRRRWTQADLEATLTDAGFVIEQFLPHVDPYGKHWLDYVLRRV